jgi:enoyl-CoA hydratase
MSDLVKCNIDNNVATISLQNGKVNAISHQVIDELNAALDQAEKVQSVVVLTGQPGMFSGGYDLKVMQKSMDDAMVLVAKGSTLSRRLLSFPYPVLAACPGHAVAKGAFLLLSADYRIGVEGDFKIGLNEIAIGMNIHYAGLEIARSRLAPVFFNRATLLAEMVNPTDAVTMGFLDKVVPQEEFEATVSYVAHAMTKLDMKAHHTTKLRARETMLRKLDEAIERDKVKL